METHIFYGLTTEKIEQAYEVRDIVFTQEQGYPSEIDIDEYDAVAWHVVLIENDQPIATARLIHVHGKDKIGRVAVVRPARGRGLGLMVMEALIGQAKTRGIQKITLHSQTHAQRFYEKLGFVVSGEIFLEDGQPHIAMEKQL